MKELERKLKAVANRRRLAILKHLKKAGPTSVGDIAEEIRLSFKSTSRHLAILFNADIVQKNQVNLNVFYSINPSLHSLIKQLLSIL